MLIESLGKLLYTFLTWNRSYTSFASKHRDSYNQVKRNNCNNKRGDQFYTCLITTPKPLRTPMLFYR